ncbi:hypothetical protein [Limosilactobacillus oris]|uniref:hypothetical protein n=1 Tax=Limosilactobacillus oris TaxID=1632 RepID=UPI0024B3268D|nr:hypothetical protein [Limosilactobacillus oris]WHO85079.1 hypothetical protein QLX69_06820 [Limosilactobacillus oris]
MEIFTAEQQQQLLMVKGINRLTRNELAKEIGVSLPTMSKLINTPTPMAVQSSIYQRLEDWLNTNVTAKQD